MPDRKSAQSSSASLLRRIVSLFRPHAVTLTWIALTILVASVLGLVPALLIQRIVDDGILKRDLNLVIVDSLLVFVAVLAGAAFTLLYGYLGVVVGQRIMCKMRDDLYQHLQSMSLKFFTNARTGDIQTRLISDVGGVQNVVSNTFTDQLSNIAIVISTIVAMFILDWRLTLLSIAIVPLFMWIGKAVGEYARVVRKGTQEQTSELNALMQETLSVSGILLTKTSGQKKVLLQRFAIENESLAGWQIKSSVVMYLFFGMIRLITQAAPALVFLLAGWLLIQGGDTSITVGKLVAFTGLQTRMFFPITGLLSAQVEIMGSFGLFERIFEYLDMRRDIEDSPNGIKLNQKETQGKIEFRNVFFKYEDGQDSWTLNNVNFVAEPGQLIALVGPSGAGKTTITYLLPRLYDPGEGQVLIDGHDLKDIELASLANVVGAVTQETYLMHSTIRENLKIAKPEATDEELIAACQAAAIHDHIAGLQEGYDTVVGERGYKLSGGEKQRLGIARAILKNPKILILDEATSALDTQSERLIQASLNELTKQRTTFAIAHRLSTILAADLILVVKNGQIVESGKHRDLLQKDGLYKKLYDEQFAAEEQTSRAQ